MEDREVETRAKQVVRPEAVSVSVWSAFDRVRRAQVVLVEEEADEIDEFFDALDDTDADFEGTFITAASPSVVTATHVNDYYDSYEFRTE